MFLIGDNRDEPLNKVISSTLGLSTQRKQQDCQHELASVSQTPLHQRSLVASCGSLTGGSLGLFQSNFCNGANMRPDEQAKQENDDSDKVKELLKDE